MGERCEGWWVVGGGGWGMLSRVGGVGVGGGGGRGVTAATSTRYGWVWGVGEGVADDLKSQSKSVNKDDPKFLLTCDNNPA